ncbi:MAG TPA: dicarboxylate/amino acid:cation symporter [Planctomycetota bacterium]|nr:dicarboxylate/amino acid:cation symporter [Planctomycetota bacterium]
MTNAPRRSSHWTILFGLIVGAAAGAIANELVGAAGTGREWLNRVSDGVAYPIGQIFLRGLMLVVMPLVFASLALGIGELPSLRKLGSLGSRTMTMFLLSTAASAVLGLFVMNTFRPGAGFSVETRTELMEKFGGKASDYGAVSKANETQTTKDFSDKILDMFLPKNVLASVVGGQPARVEDLGKVPNRLGDMLPLIVFSMLFGIALTQIADERRRVMLAWLSTLSEVMVGIVGIVMRLAPLAVFCLIFTVTAQFGLALLSKLSFYMGLVLACYLVQIFLFYPLVLRVLVRIKPGPFLKKCVPIMATALSTSSSNATLPTTLRVAKESLGVRPSVAGFVLPLGATINMNGTALFEGAVVLFVAQVFGIHLELGQQILLVLLAVISAVGAAGVPGGSLPLLMTIMSQVGVPPDGIAIILGVDRILDMGRTVVNVMGDVVTAAYVEKGEVESDARAAAGA